MTCIQEFLCIIWRYYVCMCVTVCACAYMHAHAHVWTGLFQPWVAVHVIHLAPLCTALTQLRGWSHLLVAATAKINPFCTDYNWSCRDWLQTIVLERLSSAVLQTDHGHGALSIWWCSHCFVVVSGLHVIITDPQAKDCVVQSYVCSVVLQSQASQPVGHRLEKGCGWGGWSTYK